MPDTARGLTYPASTGHTRLWEHYQALAEDVDIRLPEVFLPDAGFPAAVNITTGVGVILRYTVAAKAYARKFALVGSAFTSNTQTAQHEIGWFAGATPIGRAQADAVATVGINLTTCATYELPASTAVVFELRLDRLTGTGTVANSGGEYTQGSVIGCPA
jgi:hypothetical protein